MRRSWERVAALLVLMLALFLTMGSVALAAPPWSDAPNSYWQTNYGVTDVQVGTVAAGYVDGTFRPTQTVKRGEFAKMAVDGLGIPLAHPSIPTFVDVPLTNGFYNWIEGADAAGLVNGVTLTTFKPGDNISRQQTMSILARYLANAELNATGYIHGIGGLTYPSLDAWFAANPTFYLGFDDVGQLASNDRAATAYLVKHQIVQGSNNNMLMPTATLTRAQAATLVLRVWAEEIDITVPPAAPANVTTTPGSPGNDSTPRVSGTAVPGGLIHVYDTLGGSTTMVAAATANSAGNFYADLTTPLAEGLHSFTTKVQSGAGLVSAASAAVSYVLDTVAPTGSIIVPVVPADQADAALNSAKPIFSASAADVGVGLATVEFQYAVRADSPTWVTISELPPDQATPLGSPPYSVVWPADTDVTDPLHGGLADGQYEFRVVLTDKAGNVTILGPTAVTIDTTPPDASIIDSLIPQQGQTIFFTNSPRPLFTASAVDPGTQASGVTEVDFEYAPWSSTTPIDLWSQFTQISSDSAPAFGATYAADIQDGHYYFAVRAIDRAGNVSLLTTNGTTLPPVYAPGVIQEVIVDTVAPTGSITSPVAGIVTGPQPTFTAAAADNLGDSEIKQVEFQYGLGASPSSWTTVSIDTSSPYQADWGNASLVGGQTYTLRAIVADWAGNAMTTAPVTVTVSPSG